MTKLIWVLSGRTSRFGGACIITPAIETGHTIDKRRSIIVRNRVFDCHLETVCNCFDGHLSPNWRQM